MRHLATTLAIVATVSLSYAGPVGIVDFENFSNTLIYTNSVHNGPATGLISGGTGTYYFALFAACTSHTTVDTTLDNGTPCGWGYEDLGTNATMPGLMNGNYTTDPGVAVGWPIGSEANFVVAGWSANIGTTWAAVKAWWNNGNPNPGLSGYFGISSVAQDVFVGGGPYPVPTIFGPTPIYEVQGFTLNLYVAQVYTLPATQISGTSATLNGNINPSGAPSTTWFQWGQTTGYGNTTPVVDIGSGNSAVPVSAVLTSLSQGLWYHFRLVRNTGGEMTYGPDVAFGTTPCTFTVTSLADSGPGTLRDLLSVAAPDDNLVFAPGLTDTVTLTGPLPVVRNVAIAGPGASTLTISGNNSVQVFNLSAGATGSISGLTISGGFEPGGYRSGGAGILNGGSLTVSNCVFTGNSEQGWGARGGAIRNDGTLRLVGCVFSGNSLTGSIGSSGVNATGPFSPAGDGTPGGTASGGAIYNSGTLTALNCSFAGNTAQGGAGGNGGAGGSYSPGGKGGNGGDGLGGAIETSGSCTLINCTLANNTTVLGTGGTGGSQTGPPPQAPSGTSGAALGGGIHISPGGSVTIWNTIIAQNIGTSPDASGAFSSQGHNLVGATDGSTGWIATDVTGSTSTAVVNARLGPLQNNGGPTPTMALLSGSPALDAGDDAVLSSVPSDQRGQPRLAGIHVDIGAYESQPWLSIVTTLADPGLGSLRASMTNHLVGGNVIRFAQELSGTITLTQGELVASTNTTIVGPGAASLTISGNNASRVFNVVSGVHTTISGVTISNGRNAGVSSDGNGGGVLNQGTLVLSNCMLAGCVAVGQAGSGAGARGGAVFNGGNLDHPRSLYFL